MGEQIAARGTAAQDTKAGRSEISGGPALPARAAKIRRLIDQIRTEVDELERLVGTLPDRDAPVMTPRQHQVMQMLSHGDAEKQIARKLGLSQHTVHGYVKELHQKLGVSNRAELLARFMRRPKRD